MSEKLTKEEVEMVIKLYPIMCKKADEILEELRKYEKQHEWFRETESLNFEELKDIGKVYASGWDHDSAAGAYIPIEYFYTDDYLEEVKLKYLEEENERKMREAEQVRQKEIEEEVEERKELERLKKKYENGGN